MSIQTNYWLIQKGFVDPAYTQLVADLTAIVHNTPNVHIEFIDFIPFSIDYEIPKHISKFDNIMVYGTQSLIDYLKRKHYYPVAYSNPNFSVVEWQHQLGDELFNFDSFTDELGKMKPMYDVFFVRPVEDNKLIAGTIFTKQEFIDWKNRVLAIDDYCTVTKKTLFCQSKLQDIENEYRFFIADNQVVTASKYVSSGSVIYSTDVPVAVYEYVSSIMDIWHPEIAYCMDIAELADGTLKVIEYNCINTCGLYAADTYQYALALTKLLVHNES